MHELVVVLTHNKDTKEWGYYDLQAGKSLAWDNELGWGRIIASKEILDSLVSYLNRQQPQHA